MKFPEWFLTSLTIMIVMLLLFTRFGDLRAEHQCQHAGLTYVYYNGGVRCVAVNNLLAPESVK